MSVVTATEYKGYHIAFFDGAYRICGKLRFWKFETMQQAKDWIDAYIRVQSSPEGYF